MGKQLQALDFKQVFCHAVNAGLLMKGNRSFDDIVELWKNPFPAQQKEWEIGFDKVSPEET